MLTREHPKWQGYEVKHKIEIRFTYVSPVDGATHASSVTMTAFPKGQPLRAGDVLQSPGVEDQGGQDARALIRAATPGRGFRQWLRCK